MSVVLFSVEPRVFLVSQSGLTQSNNAAKSNRRQSTSSSASSSSAPASNIAGPSSSQVAASGDADASNAKKAPTPTHLKINLPGGVTATGAFTIINFYFKKIPGLRSVTHLVFLTFFVFSYRKCVSDYSDISLTLAQPTSSWWLLQQAPQVVRLLVT